MRLAACIMCALFFLTACQTADEETVTETVVETTPTRGGLPRVQLDDPMFPDLVDFQTRHPEGACSTDEEVLADQFIRLHTQLMVTGLTCFVPYDDPDLFVAYQDFTLSFQGRIRDSQRTLGAFLGRYMGGNRNRLFDTYRTRMANAESQTVIDVSASRYCAAQQERFYRVASFGEADLNAFLQEAAARYREHYPSCN